jgi:hypothetical protein
MVVDIKEKSCIVHVFFYFFLKRRRNIGSWFEVILVWNGL